MPEIVAKLRWFPGDALVPISEEDLGKAAQKHGVSISLEEVAGLPKVLPGGVIVEDTWDLTIEKASQSVITVSAESEEAFRRAVRNLIDMYRGPVPIWGLWGSSQRGEEIVNQLLDEDDGW